MKDMIWVIAVCLFFIVLSCALTAAIVDSNLPLWLKIVLLK